jgi:hypothetical protein
MSGHVDINATLKKHFDTSSGKRMRFPLGWRNLREIELLKEHALHGGKEMIKSCIAAMGAL